MAERLLVVRKSQHVNIQELAASGLAKPWDVMTVRWDQFRARDARTDLQQERARAARELANLMGWPGADPPKLSFEVPALVAGDLGAMPAAELESAAYDRREDLAALRWRLEVAKFDLHAARLLRMPWFSHLQGAYGEEQDGGDEEAWSIQV